jgi:hypothetical protein
MSDEDQKPVFDTTVLWERQGIVLMAVNVGLCDAVEVQPGDLINTFSDQGTKSAMTTAVIEDDVSLLILHDPEFDGPTTISMSDRDIRGMAFVARMEITGCADLTRKEWEFLRRRWNGSKLDMDYRDGKIPRTEFCSRCGSVIPKRDNLGMGVADPINGSRICHRCFDNMDYRISRIKDLYPAFDEFRLK